MEMWLRFIGLTDISHIIVEKTLFGPKVDVEARTNAKQRAAAMAARILSRGRPKGCTS